MWTVVYIAKNTEIAEKIRAILENDGMIVKVRPIVKGGGISDSSCEILVPASEVEQAHGLIIEFEIQ